jgi:chromosome segregation ATPase
LPNRPGVLVAFLQDPPWFVPDTGMPDVGLTTGEAELAQLQTERAQATVDSQSKLERRVEEARAKCRSVCDRAQARIDRLRDETNAKIEALQEQAAENADGKEKIDQRIAEIRADYDRRSAQLKQAWPLTKDALAP